MSLTLHVDGERWRTHLRATLDAHPDLVPVAKGNGYGFGLGRLARRAAWLGVDTIAVGTYDEVAAVVDRCESDVLVLTPWRPWVGDDVLAERRLVHTVSRLEDLARISQSVEGMRPARVVLERTTSMLRHGMSARELREAAALAASAPSVTVAGVALHLPLGARGNLAETERLMQDVVAAGLEDRPVWVSHLSDDELSSLASRWAGVCFRPRVGTGLWLGDRGALRVSATILDVHPVQRGDSYGYRGRTAPRNGTILVVSGGTAHGIGLESPAGDLGLRSRAATIARGGMDAAGFVRSPYVINGKHPLFAEPPHMQASMLFLPASAQVPAVGDRIDVRCRFTATDVDDVVID